MRPRRAILGLVLLAATACGGRQEVEVGDLDGRPVRPLASPSGKVVVFLFTATECPISNRYAPEMERLAARFGPRGVRFFLVYADPSATSTAIRRHLSDFGLTIEALRDPAHALVRTAGASVTPEAAVFAAAGGGPRLVYRGRIDDRYLDFGRARAAPTRHDLAEALEAALAGRPVAEARTRAIGCFIPGPA